MYGHRICLRLGNSMIVYHPYFMLGSSYISHNRHHGVSGAQCTPLHPLKCIGDKHHPNKTLSAGCNQILHCVKTGCILLCGERRSEHGTVGEDRTAVCLML